MNMRQNLTSVLREYLRLVTMVPFGTGFGGVHASFIRYADTMQADDNESLEKSKDMSILKACRYKSDLDSGSLQRVLKKCFLFMLN
jgi:hypothetical protein